MDDTLKKILSMTGAKEAYLACAAARVLGALNSSDKKVAEALRGLLAHENAAVSLAALEASAPTAGPEILGQVVPLLARPAPLNQRASAFVEKHLDKAAKLLVAALGRGPALTRAALGLLSQAKGVDPADLLAALREPDADVVREAAEGIRALAAGIPEKRRGAFLKAVRTFSGTKQIRAHPEALAACVKILGAAAPEDDLETLLAYAGKPFPTRVRRIALFSLAKRPVPKAKAKGLAKAALSFLGEEDPALAEAAVDLLKKLPAEGAWGAPMTKLLTRAGPAREFAMETLGKLGGKSAQASLLPLLTSPDRELRRQAAHALTQGPDALRDLIDRIDRKMPNEAAWSLAEALKTARSRFSEKDKKHLRDRALALLKKQDPAAEVLLAVAREAAAQETAEALLKLAAGQKDAVKRSDLLKTVLRVDPECAGARTTLALGEIRTSPKILAPESRRSDRALGALMGLARADAKDCIRALGADRELKPEDLYYIGFHASEQAAPLTDFGREAMKLLVKRFPRHELAKAAKNKAGL